MNRKQFEAKFFGGLIFGRWREMLDALHQADHSINRAMTPECVHDTWVSEVKDFHQTCLLKGGGSHIFYLSTGVHRMLVAFDGQTLKTELLGCSDETKRREWEGES